MFESIQDTVGNEVNVGIQWYCSSHFKFTAAYGGRK